MKTSLTTAMRRFASTLIVLVALFVACIGAHAAPRGGNAFPVGSCQHDAANDTALAAASDDAAGVDELASSFSLEDNGGELDDTFDVPPEYLVSVPRAIGGRLAGITPTPHSHHPSLDLRPPIA